MKWTLLMGLGILFPVAVLAHNGELAGVHDLWTAWRFDAGTVVPLGLSALLYGAGARTAHGARKQEMVFFWAGWCVLALALLSPMHPLGEQLFSVHMAQHEILMLFAAPLMVLSRPLVPMLWALPPRARRGIGRWSKGPGIQTVWRSITNPMAAWWIHAIALWLWHVPALFQATLTSEVAHAAQHASFFLSALLFWWSLFYARARSSAGASVLFIFTTALHTSILGALLTFSREPWYPAYGNGAALWGLSPLEDQQIGGLIMWVPAGLVYLAAGLAMIVAWLRGKRVAGDEEAFCALES